MYARLFPAISWLKGYNFSMLRLDALAGLTVALVLIPQSMAYAQLAGLPVYYGLYASFLPPMVAALFGSSRQLATGPVAVVSLMSAASLAPLASAGSSEFIAYSILLALIIGAFQFSLGVLKLGLVVNFLSHPVVNGFTNAAALIIASSQLAKFFGVEVDNAPHHYQTMIMVAQAALDFTHLPTLLFGLGALALMFTLRKINRRIPDVLLAVTLATLISYFTGYSDNRTVTLAELPTTQVAEMVVRYNNRQGELVEQSRLRAELGAQIDHLQRELDRDRGERLELVALKNRHNLVNAAIEETGGEIRDLRSHLRKLRFTAVEQNGRLLYHAGDDRVAGAADSGQIWRLKVGSGALDLEELTMMGGGAVVGTIPRGLPPFAVPKLSLDAIVKLVPMAVIISLLGFMEAIAIAKAIAAKTGQRLDPNQELIGQGLANMTGALSSSFAVSGSFSRSAVNFQAGGVTGMSSVVTSLVVLLTLLFLTPLLYHLPQAVLAAVIVMAVIGLLNISGFIHAWKAQWYDGAISILTFLVTLAAAPHLETGIMVGVVLSMGVFLYKSMRPVVATLSLHEDKVLKSAEHYRLQGCRHIAVIRFDGPLFFANASYLDEQVAKYREQRPDLRYIILEASGINDMDASGEEVLALLVERLRAAGIGFAISSAKGAVLAVLERTHLLNKIGWENFYPDSKSAVENLVHKIHQHSDLPEGGCKSCPLTQYLPLEGGKGSDNRRNTKVKED
ncbi:MAG TPA: SulP family inorganic anion transporter [Desulfurivibrio alkaliphilus]|uniref:SulP family inorganic anion transporter n=1 Tax=Desulfurivibrio alkaliphilus TaxID=427923 RepID=A0A7C2XVI6_9BACT|nr:SulP family inorganic anion transporter [Desulfurivibrio alkaliphilus]